MHPAAPGAGAPPAGAVRMQAAASPPARRYARIYAARAGLCRCARIPVYARGTVRYGYAVACTIIHNPELDL